MGMRKIKKLVATTGETNQGKKTYQTMGFMFKDENERVSLKIDCIPTSPQWTGWVNVYDLDTDKARQAVDPTRQPVQPQKSYDDFEDPNIPF